MELSQIIHRFELYLTDKELNIINDSFVYYYSLLDSFMMGLGFNVIIDDIILLFKNKISNYKDCSIPIILNTKTLVDIQNAFTTFEEDVSMDINNYSEEFSVFIGSKYEKLLREIKFKMKQYKIERI